MAKNDKYTPDERKKINTIKSVTDWQKHRIVALIMFATLGTLMVPGWVKKSVSDYKDLKTAQNTRKFAVTDESKLRANKTYDAAKDEFGASATMATILVLLFGGAMGMTMYGLYTRDKKAYEKLFLAELLKRDGVASDDCDAVLREVGVPAVTALSEIDPGYMENLLRGGISEADKRIWVAIAQGYVNSHPSEYTKVREFIDNNTRTYVRGCGYDVVRQHNQKTK